MITLDPPADTLTRVSPLRISNDFEMLYLIFNHEHRLFDNLGYLEVRIDDGPWEVVTEFSGEQDEYTEVLLWNEYVGTDSLFMRFRLEPVGKPVLWDIDDIYLSTTPTILTAQASTPRVPLEYSLDSPYPNPFNPTTTVEFSVPRSGVVTLRVYDLLGRETGTIVNQHMDAGHHRVQWTPAPFLPGSMFSGWRPAISLK